jgi:hypothetical protein
MASAGAACASHVRGAGAAQLGHPVQRAAHGASARRRRYTAAAWLGDGAARRADGGTAPAHGRRRGGRGGTAAVRAAWLRTAAVGMRAVRARLGRDGIVTGEACGSGREAVGGGRRERGLLSGRAAHSPDSGFKSRHRHGAWQPCGNGALPRGPGAARGV